MEKTTIRRALPKDMDGINRLLCQVLMVHHNGRPDLFKPNAKKYTDEELAGIIADEKTPIFVMVDEADNDRVMGYAFCILKENVGHNILTDIKSCYIDDLCVDEELRGLHIGTKIYDYVVNFAKKTGCYNVTLNVWACNPGAMAFYEKVGLTEFKRGMEKIL